MNNIQKRISTILKNQNISYKNFNKMMDFDFTNKMSNDNIKKVADYFGISVQLLRQGKDNSKYFNKVNVLNFDNALNFVELTIIEEDKIMSTKRYDFSSPSDAQSDKPTFPIIWEKIKENFQSAIIASPNALSDIHQLKYLLTYYDIQEPIFNYFDIRNICNEIVKSDEVLNFELLCKKFDICNNNSLAAAELLLKCYKNSECDKLSFYIFNTLILGSFADVKINKIITVA